MNRRLAPLLAIAALLLLADSCSLFCQVEVAPTRIMLSMRERAREVTVSNTTDGRLEIDIDLGFKLIRSDSLGAITLDDTARTADERSRSARSWIQVYPRRFTLAPRASRMVRVMVLVPDSVPEGEYWSRMVVAGTPTANTPVDGGDTTGIQTNLTMRLQLDLPIIVRKGTVSTGIDLRALTPRSFTDASLLLVDLKRSGNSAYRGTLRAIVQREGAEIARAEDQFTAEFSLRKALRLPRLADGTYALMIESESVKRGGANDAVIPADMLRRSYELVVERGTMRVVPRDTP